MKVAVPQQDLQLLALSLQHEVESKIPSGDTFQIKCVVKKDELLILAQHPVGVTVKTEDIFVLLKKALQSSLTEREQPVQCFLKKLGEELPYAKCSFIIQQREKGRSSIPLSSSLTYNPPIVEDEPEPEFEVWVDTPDSLITEPQYPVKFLLLGITILGTFIFGSGFYLLSRPCVVSECQEMRTAEQLKRELPKMIRSANSANELIAIQQQLDTASSDLGNIPFWSGRYKQGEQLQASLSMQSNQIQQVVKAFEAGDIAEKKMPPTGNNLRELQEMQHLWRVAIASLEAISPTSELQSIVEPRLSKYRVSLQSINQEFLGEEQWLKKINDAKAVAIVAQQRSMGATSLSEWQKAQATWQIAMNALNIIPSTSPAYSEAQNLLSEYQTQLARTRDRTTREEIAARNYQEAINMGNQARTYEEKNQWQIAAQYWSQGLKTAQQVSQDSFYYHPSQRLIQPYATAFQQAEKQVQTVTRLEDIRYDLDDICTREVRVCTFTINNTGIAVSLTPDYEHLIYMTLLSRDTEDTTNHWDILQEALGRVGDRVNLPVFIYDTQGQGLHTHIPVAGNNKVYTTN
ncbi:hypothetical protein [Nodularia chucula]|uniref:hypothetical protein n=1 Tax=Nodularia chucula TaxID=3093667 RepID=UPI0039C5FBC8